MATPKTVTGKMLNPSDAGQKGAITATLSQVAYVNGGEVVSPTVDGIVLTDGTWSFDPAASNGLYSNSDLTPANTYYTFAESVGWHQVSQDGVVPAGAGPFVLKDIVISSAPLPVLAIPESQVINLVADLAALGGGSGGGAVLSVAGRTGAVVLAEADITSLASDLALKAPLANPTFTGTVTVPAPPVNPTDAVAKSYVDSLASLVAEIETDLGEAIPESQVTNLTTDLAAKAPLASPAFTGSPTFPAGAVAAAALAAIPESGVTNLTTDLAAKVPTARQIASGTGLTGGGDLTADRTLAVAYGAAAGTAAAGNDSRFTAVSANIQTANYALVLTDAGLVVEMNVAGANTLTVPTNASVAFPIGTILEVFQVGAGQCTITAAGGVTFRSDGAKAKTAAQYASVSLRKRGTDEWVLAGDLA